MKLLAILFLLPTLALAGWYQRGDQWLQSDTGIPWTAKGYVARTDAEKAAYDCAKQGGTLSNGVCVVPPPVVTPPAPAQFESGIEASRVTINPNFDSHGYDLIVDPDDNLVIGVERYSTPKTDAEVAVLREQIRAQRRANKQAILDLIDRRMDATNCNNVVTASNGQFTIFSRQLNAIKGATATSKQGNRWRGVTLINSASNSVTFQVWSAATTKAGAETNDWSILLFK